MLGVGKVSKVAMKVKKRPFGGKRGHRSYAKRLEKYPAAKNIPL
jgi:hypothetical protein